MKKQPPRAEPTERTTPIDVVVRLLTTYQREGMMGWQLDWLRELDDAGLVERRAIVHMLDRWLAAPGGGR